MACMVIAEDRRRVTDLLREVQELKNIMQTKESDYDSQLLIACSLIKEARGEATSYRSKYLAAKG